jgi:transposase
MDYMLKRWIAFTRFLEDGRVCLSNNAAERGVRGIALGRKSWLFCGSDRGGERAAIMYSLIVTVIPVLPSMHAIEAPRPVRR